MTATLWTIGYGGRKPAQFIDVLHQAGIECVADVRISPRGAMGSYTKASSPERGIERLLGDASIRYRWFPELGNPDRQDREMHEFRSRVVTQLDILAAPLAQLASSCSTCLLCGCRRAAGCHRALIAAWFARQGWRIIDIE